MTNKDITKPAGDRNVTLAEHVAAIRQLGKQTISSIIAIGGHLSACKKQVGTRDWACWLDRELGWSERAGANFMSLFELSKSKNANFAETNLPVSALYQLAAPSTPETVRDEILERSKSGEKFKLKEVEAAIATAKPARARKSSPKASNTSPMPEETVAPVGDVASSGEYARLQKQIDALESAKRRLETKNIGLRSEVDELKARNKPKVADAKDTICCSFCNKSQHDVRRMVASSSTGPQVFICNECIKLCNEILDSPATKWSKAPAEPAPVVDDGLDIPEALRRSAAAPDSEPDTNIPGTQKTVH